MDLEGLKLFVVSVIVVALAVERGVELFRPLFAKISEPNLQNSAKIGIAIVLGLFVAALLQIDVLAMLGLNVPVWGSYAAAGVLASAGAAPWHALLEWLKTLKDPRIAVLDE